MIVFMEKLFFIFLSPKAHAYPSTLNNPFHTTNTRDYGFNTLGFLAYVHKMHPYFIR